MNGDFLFKHQLLSISIEEHPWAIVLILAVIYNAISWYYWNSAKNQILKHHPDNTKLREYAFGRFLFGNTPFAIALLCTTTGTEPDLDIFLFDTFSFYKTLFDLSVVMVDVLIIRWVFFKDGAKFISRYNLVNTKGKYGSGGKATPELVKLYVILFLAGQILISVIRYLHK